MARRRDLNPKGVKSRCWFCHARLTDENRTIDHLRPRSRGGSNKNHNLAWACYSCNQRKGNMDESEFRARYGYHRGGGILIENPSKPNWNISASEWAEVMERYADAG